MYHISLKGRIIAKGHSIAQAKVNALQGMNLVHLEEHYDLIDRMHGLIFKPKEDAPEQLKKSGSILFKVGADKESV